MDPIADMFSTIRNAQAVAKKTVTLPSSTTKEAIARKMVELGFLKGAARKGKKPHFRLELELAYFKQDRPRIQILQRISKPGRRIYARADRLKKRPYEETLLFTPRGILTVTEAKRNNVGGELIARIR